MLVVYFLIFWLFCWVGILTFSPQKDFIPSEDNRYSLGSDEKRWKSLLVQNIEFGDGSTQLSAHIPPVPVSFDPQFDTTTPAVTFSGNQNVKPWSASYTMITSKLCFYRVFVDFARFTNYGTLQYKVRLPFASAASVREAKGVFHVITGTGAPIVYHIAGIVDIQDDASLCKFYYFATTTDLLWKYNTPYNMATQTASHFDFNIIYEISS